MARKLILNGGAIRPTGLLFKFSAARKLILNGGAIRPTGSCYYISMVINDVNVVDGVAHQENTALFTKK